jgi:hypothetical protein
MNIVLIEFFTTIYSWIRPHLSQNGVAAPAASMIKKNHWFGNITMAKQSKTTHAMGFSAFQASTIQHGLADQAFYAE